MEADDVRALTEQALRTGTMLSPMDRSADRVQALEQAAQALGTMVDG